MNGFGETPAVKLRVAAAIVLAVLGLVMVRLGPARGAERPAAQVPAATAAAGSGILISVSCTSARACMAVGSYDTSGPAERGYTLAEAWNGKTWIIIPTPNPTSSLGNNLYGVSCSSANACMAVGGHQIPHGGVPLAEAWNGKTWTVKPTPKPDNDSALDSVSCSSANACIATGFAIQNNGNNWFSEAWNGRTWTIKPAPRPNGTTFSGLDGVSCASGSLCIAAGDYEVDNSSKSRTLAETWNGETWTINTTANPRDGANGSDLTGVSCSSADACMAVGGYSKPSNRGGLTLAEIWNGKTWTIRTSRNSPTSTGSSLEGVSCRSAHACMAVGEYFTNSGSGGLAKGWNGKIWTIEPIPNPGGATGITLDSVSCGSAHACIAVGSYLTGRFSPGVPLTEAWNGKTWTIRRTPF
jgi:hypothetical protein